LGNTNAVAKRAVLIEHGKGIKGRKKETINAGKNSCQLVAGQFNSLKGKQRRKLGWKMFHCKRRTGDGGEGSGLNIHRRENRAGVLSPNVRFSCVKERSNRNPVKGWGVV